MFLQNNPTPIVTDWVSFTSTLNSNTNVSGQAFWWRRVGDSIQVRGSIRYGGAGAAGTLTTTLPATINGTSITIDTGKMDAGGTNRNTFGSWEWYDNAGSAACRSGSVEYNLATSPITLSFRRSDDSNTLDSSVFAASDVFMFFAQIPITGWTTFI
jgi:hypothetical protein